MNNRGRVEHHQEFWVLVAGQELAWVECGGSGHINNMVRLPGPQTGGAESVGMFGDIVGTVNKCRVSNNPLTFGSIFLMLSAVHVRSVPRQQ